MALPEMRRIVADTLRLILFIGLPATLLLMMLSEPIVTVAFQRGAFTGEDTTLVAWALLFYAPGLLALAGLEVVSRAFYALEDTKTPVLAGALQLGMMALLAYLFSAWLFPRLGWESLGGLALGVSLSNLLETALLLWLLRGRLRGIAGHHLLDGAWRMALSALLMVVVVWLVQSQFATAGAFWELLVAAMAGGLTYLVATWGLQVPEIRDLVSYGRRLARSARP